MESNPLLYQAFPGELSEAYEVAVRAQDWSGKHGGLLSYAEGTLWYLASLCLSDYRTRSKVPVGRVESLLENWRNKNLTLGRVLELLRRSAAAIPDPLIPPPGAFPRCELRALGELKVAVDAIEGAINGLKKGTLPSAVLDVRYLVESGTAEVKMETDWWASWKALIEYRNKVAHTADTRWPTSSEGYWEAMTPLLHDAIVELLTQPVVSEAILSHPVATVTIVTQGANGHAHSVCGEDRGVYFDRQIVTPEPITERWKDEEWGASTASSYILDPADDGWAFRSMFWDLHNGLPPAMDMRVGEAPEPAPTKEREARKSTRSPIGEGRGTAPGTCGEFAQGILPDGTPFHVTCPINKSASVIAQIRPASAWSVDGLRPDRRKLGLALEYAAEELQLGAVQVTIRHWSDLDIGKGMGSSTADVLAAIRAIAAAAGTSLDVETEGRLAARVESSDGSMYPGIAAVNHKTCELVKTWAWFPEFVIVMLVPHDRVDTPSISFQGQEKLADEYEVLLREMDDAIARRSIADFAVQSTRSAELNERFLSNPHGRYLSDHLDEFSALGINVGHTGTVCGLLFANADAGRRQASEACFAVRKKFPELKDVKVVTTPHCPEIQATLTQQAPPG
jgi:L-threonine kinase